jgi:outer membrane protein assembly factor BamB
MTCLSRRHWIAATSLAMLSAKHAFAENSNSSAVWPHILGPNGTNDVDAVLPTEWSDVNNVLWNSPVIGKGWSSPVVGDGLVWLTTAPEDGGVFIVLAFDLATGRQVRRIDLFPKSKVHPVNKLNSYASPSPVLDVAKGRLYVHFGRYGTACIETSTGNVLWKRNDITLDHGEGPGSSPALWENRLIIPCDGKDVQFVIGLDADTGEPAWKTNRSVDLSAYDPEMKKAFATPAVVDIGGRATVLSQGAHAIYAYDPATGEEWWKVEHPSGFSTCSVPQVRDNILVVATGYMKPQLWGVKLSGSGADTKTEIIWRHTSNCPNMPSPVVHNDMVFLISDNSGVCSCLDLDTGKVHWTQRIGGNFSATPLVAGKSLYLFDREGRTTVVAADSKFKKVGQNMLFNGGCMASPAVVGKSLILRTQQALYRIEAL